MSDLHLEMENWRPDWRGLIAGRRGARHPSRGPALHRVGEVDLVILAGDIHNGLRGVIYADQVAQYLDAPVVVIAGNHEFYHHDMATLLPALRQAVVKTEGRVQFLQNDRADFKIRGESVYVLGCSLWTDYALNGDAPAAMAYAQSVMNDHAFITLNNGPFSPADAAASHRQSVAWLHENLAEMKSQRELGRAIVVTHHAPSAIALGRRQGVIAPAYGSEILAAFAHHAPAVWVHGHTHYAHASLVDGIRLVSAPRGYVGSGNAAYKPGFMEI